MQTTTRHFPAEVLLVEDNPDDVLLTKRGFASCPYSVRVHHVENGRDCLAFLRKEGSFSAAPTPDLVLLDLNMPVMNGREVLSAIAADERLKRLPIIILSTSNAEQDIEEMYRLCCNSYVIKPVDYDDFEATLERISEYWLDTALLPSKPSEISGEASDC